MKLIDAIKNVDRSAGCEWTDCEALCDDLDINHYSINSEKVNARLKDYYLVKWLCTDTHVGLNVYFLDDDPVAITTQTSRHAKENVQYISKEAREKVRDFLISTLVEPEDQSSYIDPNEEIGDHYTVAYGSQLLTDTGFYNSQEVTIVKNYGLRCEGPSDMWHKIDVKLPDGKVETIHLDDFHIPYCLKKEP